MKEKPEAYEADIYENSGSYTKQILDDKIFGFAGSGTVGDADYQACKIGGAMLTDREIARQFCDSLRKLIQDCGYTGATGTDKDALRQMKAFLHRAFQGLGTDDVITDKTLGRWLSGESSPDHSEKSRESVFQLMFALNVTLEQSAVFFQKAYYSQPFNFRSIHECIYYWCLKNRCPWETVQAMKAQIAEMQRTLPELHSFSGETVRLGKSLSEIETQSEAVIYIANNVLPDEVYFHRAKEAFADLLEEAKEKAEAEYELYRNREMQCFTGEVEDGIKKDDREKKDSLGYRRQKNSIDFLLLMIFGGSEALKPRKDWEVLIRENFPTKEQFRRCAHDAVTNGDILRKCLILLMFFNTYAGVESNPMDFDAFYENVSFQLEECGFPILYAANPYDRLFLTCVFCSEDGYSPLDCFREIFS